MILIFLIPETLISLAVYARAPIIGETYGTIRIHITTPVSVRVARTACAPITIITRSAAGTLQPAFLTLAAQTLAAWRRGLGARGAAASAVALLSGLNLSISAYGTIRIIGINRPSLTGPALTCRSCQTRNSAVTCSAIIRNQNTISRVGIAIIFVAFQDGSHAALHIPACILTIISLTAGIKGTFIIICVTRILFFSTQRT